MLEESQTGEREQSRVANERQARDNALNYALLCRNEGEPAGSIIDRASKFANYILSGAT